MLTPRQMRLPRLLTKRKSWVSFEIKDGLKMEEVSDKLCLLKEWK